jgi:hypothetical protein
MKEMSFSTRRMQWLGERETLEVEGYLLSSLKKLAVGLSF